MSSSATPRGIACSLLAKAGLELQEIEQIQSLWAGYGYIYRLTAIPISDVALVSTVRTPRSLLPANSATSPPLSQPTQSLILKLIAAPSVKDREDEGNARKTLSYRVEHYFYTNLAPQLPASIAVADCIANINEMHIDGKSTTAMILSDLRQSFPIAGGSRDLLSPPQVNAALEWLASFHGFWRPRVPQMRRSSLVRPPLEEISSRTKLLEERTVWLNGGYSYLATRRAEYKALASDEHSEWKQLLTEPDISSHASVAEMVAAILSPSETGNGPWEEYYTIIHGDCKSENLFTSLDGSKAAFFDFQYVGLGLGVSDLAKLFTVSVPLDLLCSSTELGVDELNMQPGEESLLRQYIKIYQDASQTDYDWKVFKQHWKMALVDWLRFQAGWGFWGNTDWLEARVRHILQDEEWQEAVRNSYRTQ